MKRTTLIISSILVFGFFFFRLIDKHRKELTKERVWYLNNLHYDLSGTIDSIQIENSPHGLIYFHITQGRFDVDKEFRLKEKLKLHTELFLLNKNKLGLIEMASEHASDFFRYDSIVINSDRNEIGTYRNGTKISSNNLLTSLRGGEY